MKHKKPFAVSDMIRGKSGCINGCLINCDEKFIVLNEHSLVRGPFKLPAGWTMRGTGEEIWDRYQKKDEEASPCKS
jgi:hypothetical protein